MNTLILIYFIVYEQNIENKIDHYYTPHPRIKEDISIKRFEIGKCLGIGSLGNVFLARDLVNNFIFALKVVKNSDLRSSSRIKLEKEKTICKILQHKNVVEYYGQFYDDTRTYLMYEYCCEGNLLNYIKYNKTNINEQIASNFIKQILDALKYIHSFDIIHRDIKPENILVSFGTVKLSDFGSSCKIDDSNTPISGTLEYLSPEQVRGEPNSQATDLWCVGVIAYELVCGKNPFVSSTRSMILQNIYQIKYDKLLSVSQEFRDFLQKIFKYPRNITAQQLLETKWIKSKLINN